MTQSETNVRAGSEYKVNTERPNVYKDSGSLWVKVVSTGGICGSGPGRGPGPGDTLQVSHDRSVLLI